MTRSVLLTLCIAAMIIVVVSADVMFFRDHFWQRLMTNVGIVLVFAAFYLRFLN